MSAHGKNLRRVQARIEPLILEFVRHRRNIGWPCFHMQALTDFVNGGLACGVAPDSPGRILRQLRRAGTVQYRVINRAESLYELL